MITIERRNGEQVARLQAAGVLFDRGCFMVTGKGLKIEPRRTIKSFADLEIFDALPSRKGSRTHTLLWIQAKNRSGQ